MNSNLISTALRRGLRKRCPHCGEGRLFSGWSEFERCSICGLVFVRNAGDTWAFTIIGDRVPLAAMIVLIYFGVVRSHRVLGLTMMVVLVALAVWTTPNRWGAGIALHYLSRVYRPIPRILFRRLLPPGSQTTPSAEPRSARSFQFSVFSSKLWRFGSQKPQITQMTQMQICVPPFAAPW